jgi:phosphoribosylformylglycinamidine synthase
MSMTQKYPDGSVVYSPGTVIVSTVAEVQGVRKTIKPVMKADVSTSLLYVDLSDGNFSLGGSSLAQILSQLGNDTPDISDPVRFKNGFNAVQQLVEGGMLICGHDVSSGGLITALLEMCFANTSGGAEIDLSGFPVQDPVRACFTEQPALVLQTAEPAKVGKILQEAGVRFYLIGAPTSGRTLNIKGQGFSYSFEIDNLRDTWYKTSYLLDRKQSGPVHARSRFENYSKQPLVYTFPKSFSGKFDQYGIDPGRRKSTGIRAAIIREKGVNGDREMAYAMHLSGMDVKDVHMTDLITGRETLEDLHMIVFVGGFSNSDVLGSAKGWAGAFLYNPKAKNALENFYKRRDTLSLGVCNGCQVMMELDLVYPDHSKHPKMHLNKSGKFESGFFNVDILPSNSVMLGSLAGSRLGVWVAHAEGQFMLSEPVGSYNSPLRFSYSGYPGNPNGSPADIAGMCSSDGRHLVMMPHLERAFLPWQWPHYPGERTKDETAPWLEAFVNAREWIKTC